MYVLKGDLIMGAICRFEFDESVSKKERYLGTDRSGDYHRGVYVR
jgi:hypothetical protein